MLGISSAISPVTWAMPTGPVNSRIGAAAGPTGQGGLGERENVPSATDRHRDGVPDREAALHDLRIGGADQHADGALSDAVADLRVGIDVLGRAQGHLGARVGDLLDDDVLWRTQARGDGDLVDRGELGREGQARDDESSTDGELRRTSQPAHDRLHQVEVVLDPLALDLQDLISRSQSRLLGGGVGRYSGYGDGPNYGVVRQGEQDGEYSYGEREVHHGAGDEDDRALPSGLPGKASWVGRVLLADHADESA